MTRNPTPSLSAALWLILMPIPGELLAQDPEATAGTDPDVEDPSRETDISEDNYRRFMELDDRRLERPAFPVSSVQPTTSLQKLGQLPESSQKHLRNQLRGIILSRGAWTPAQREEPYPFVPSAAARGDAQLLRQEAEAWAELVDEYHDREAAILAGATGRPASEDGTGSADQGQPGQPAADASTQQANAGAGGNPGSDQQQGEDGEPGQEGQKGAQGESGSEGGPDGKSGSASSAGSPPPEAPDVPEWVAEDESERSPRAPGNEGVEQSASEYLKARGLADSAPAGLEGAQARTPAPAAAEQASRWGEEYQDLLGDPEAGEMPPRRRTSPPPPEDSAGAGAPVNSLTRDELRQVRGVAEEVTPPENAFGQFDLGVTAPTAPGEEVEEPVDAVDEPRGDPDDDDG